MTDMIGIVINVYRLLLLLYPRSFRIEFEEQMLLDFADMAADAKEKGRRSFALFCLRELIDFPVNLLRVYYQEGQMFKMLRSQPVHYGFRGAVAFGVTFFLGFIINEFIWWKLDSSGDSMIGYLQVYYYDLFHTEHGMELIAWIPSVIASLLTGLAFGTVFALLFAKRSEYSRYITVGVLGWFLHFAVDDILLSSFNVSFFLGPKHTIYLLTAISILSGSFLGLLFIITKGEKQAPVRWLLVGAFVYPMLMYFYVRLLFKLGLVETPKMFIALMFMVCIYIGSVFFLAIKIEGKRKIPWIVIISAVGYFLMPYLVRLIPQQLFPSVTFPNQMYYTDPIFWKFTILTAIQQAIYVIPFGLLIGVALALQHKSNPPELAG
jgi:hypothetical protein